MNILHIRTILQTFDELNNIDLYNKYIVLAL